jgi:hypothetical protein
MLTLLVGTTRLPLAADQRREQVNRLLLTTLVQVLPHTG